MGNKKVFEEISIGSMKMKNRIFRAATGDAHADQWPLCTGGLCLV